MPHSWEPRTRPMHMSSWALSELVEAAARCGRPEATTDALGRLA